MNKGSRLFAVLLILLVGEVSCTSEEETVRRDLLKMSRMVGALQLTMPDIAGESGFPPSAFRNERGEPTTSWRLGFARHNSESPPDMRTLWSEPKNQRFDTDARRRTYAIGIGPGNAATQYTQVFALVGPGTAFTEFQADKNPNMGDLPPDAILLLEHRNNTIHWMEPGDIEVENLQKGNWKTGIGGLQPNYADGYLVAFADGAVWYIRKDVPREAISKFFTVKEARQNDRGDLLGPYVLDRISPLQKD